MTTTVRHPPAPPATPTRKWGPPSPRRLLAVARLQHPARLAVAALAVALVLVGLGDLLDDWQLPGWSLPGAVVVLVAYVAVVAPLRRFVATTTAHWNSACAAYAALRWLSHLLEVPAVLARLAVPLAGLPIVLMLFAARGLAPWQQSCLGAAAMVIALLVVHAERPTLARARAWIGNRRRSRRSAGAVAAAAYVVIPVVGLFVASRQSNVIQRINQMGGFVTWVALFAVAVWIVAGMLRLASFAASPIRLLGFVPIGLAAARGAAALGIIPGEELAQRIALPWWAWIALFAAGVLLMIVANPLHHRTSSVLPTWRHAAVAIEALGFGAALLASVVFFVAIVLAVDSSGSYGRPVSAMARGPEHPGMPKWTHLPASDQRLAEQFAPILELDAKEPWPLSSVDGYLSTAALAGGRENVRHLTAATLPTSCRSATGGACFALTCRADTQPCDSGTPIGHGGGARGVEYARVFRVSRRADAAAFIPPKPIGGEPIAAVVEYWLFYPYDRWRAETAVGVLTQQHGADWEVVIVGFSERGPVFVGYSAHCAGTWYRWTKTEARTAALFPGDEPDAPLHPLVAVALGSHANYVDAAAQRASDWGSCTHVSRKATAALTYTWNVRDRTSADYELRPAKVVLVTDGKGPTSFPGRWSTTDTTTLQNARMRTLASGRGPTSPALKPLWRTPLWEIFRSGGWHHGH